MSVSAEVTLIIPAHGRLQETAGLLSSLAQSQASYAIILVDDGTETPLSKQLPAYPGLRLTHLRNPSRQGPAVARNLGLTNASTRYVAFTDNDVSVSPTWIETLYQHLCAAPEDVAGVGGRVIDDGRNLVGRYCTCLRLLDPYKVSGRVAYLVTANCMFRRAALIKVGGFDESFEVPGGEDTELSFRVLAAGFRLECCERAVVTHHYRGSWLAFWKLFGRYGRGCRQAMEALRPRQSLINRIGGCEVEGSEAKDSVSIASRMAIK